MSYLVLARKYRPRLFDEVVAQQHVTRTLVNALGADRISHSYLFSGPRGVGKTTTARLLARAVNCTGGDGADPCNECESCTAILRGNSMDVLEIDGASNRGIDEIRDLRERVGYAPSSSRYKVYIIDEVHMLTSEAFNALLKTLEEPPSHVIFIFATTAPHKVPPTILSRCQRFDFKAVPTADIIVQLEKVFAAEKVEMGREVVEMVARKADGAMRDALSLADQVIAFCDGDYTVEKASQVLGLLDTGLLLRLSEMIEGRNTLAVVEFVDELAENGVDLEEFYAELARHYRNLIVYNLGVKDPSALDVPAAQQEAYRACAEKFGLEDLVRAQQLILQFEEIFKFSGQQKIALELLLVRLTMMEKSVNISDLLARLTSGGTPAGDSGVKKNDGRPVRPAEPAHSTAPVQQPPNESGPSPGAGPMGLEQIRENWTVLLARIRRERPHLAAQLGKSRPVSLEDGLLTVETPAEGFDISTLNRSETTRLLARCASEGFGMERPRVKIVAVKPAKDTGRKTGGGREESAESFEQLCRSNPLMGKIKELFDPELLQD